MSSESLFKNAPSSNVPDLAGKFIDNGRLQLIKKIGRGAWGIVYMATTVGDNPQIFAVKAISSHDSPDYQRILSREISLHNICSQHHGVLRLHDVIREEEDNLVFIVTDYCPDGDLLTLILAGKFIGRNELIKSVFVQVLDALESCHNKNIYHRDIKPENILCLDGGKRTMLADFGFATTETHSNDFRMGSEPFMSPEVRGGLRSRVPRYSTPHADIWAMGVVLMNLACGCLPWAKASMNDPHFFNYIMRDRDHLYHTFPISRELNEILKGVFTADPRTRISVAEFRRLILNVKSFSILDPPTEDICFASQLSGDDSFGFLGDGDDAEEAFTALANATLELRPISPEREVPDRSRPTIRVDAKCRPSNPSPLRQIVPAINASRAPRTSRLPSFESDSDGEISDFVSPVAPLGDLSTYSTEEQDDDNDDDDSDCDSEGPITPEQLAADAGGVGPELEEVPEIPALADDPHAQLPRWEIPPPFFPRSLAKPATGLPEQKTPPCAAPDNDIRNLGRPSARRMLRNAVRRLGLA